MEEYILNGSKFIKQTIRPPRIAIVVNSLEDVNKFISIASLSWGGRHFLAIPSTEEFTITDEWLTVLRKYNPDSIFTFCELAQNTKENLWKCRFTSYKFAKPEDASIEYLHNDYQKGERIPEFIGQPILNLMLVDDFYKDKDNKPHLAYVSLPTSFNLYYQARYGVIDENEWVRWQQIYIGESHRKSCSGELIENGLSSQDLDILSCIYKNRNAEVSGEFLSLIDYTRTRLSFTSSNRLSIVDRSKSESSQIAIISDKENIEDFCWYWALRGQRSHRYYNYSAGPIWINIELLNQNVKILKDLFTDRENIYVISKSIPYDLLPMFGNNWVVQTDNLQEFYNSFYYIGDNTEIPVNLVENETEYKFEVPDSCKYISAYHKQYAISEIKVPDVTLPTINQFHNELRYGTHILSFDYQTKSGLAHRIITNKDEIIKLRIPTPWEVISTFAENDGYHIENSDKGVIGNELIRLIGGIENLWIISHPAVIDLLLELSNVNKINDIRKLIRENIQNIDVTNGLINSLPRKSLQRKIMLYSGITKLLIERDETEKT